MFFFNTDNKLSTIFVLSPSLLTAFAILCDWLKIVSYGSAITETHAPRHYSVDLVYFWYLVINRILTFRCFKHKSSAIKKRLLEMA